MVKIIYKCKHCSSENIRWDAWAVWDEVAQEMILHSHYDTCWCEDCEGETNVIEEPLQEDACPSCGSYQLDQVDELTCVDDYHEDDPLYEVLQEYLRAQ